MSDESYVGLNVTNSDSFADSLSVAVDLLSSCCVTYNASVNV